MIWTQESIRNTVEAQRRFFRSGATLDVSWRIAQLKALKAAVRERQDLARRPQQVAQKIRIHHRGASDARYARETVFQKDRGVVA